MVLAWCENGSRTELRLLGCLGLWKRRPRHPSLVCAAICQVLPSIVDMLFIFQHPPQTCYTILHSLFKRREKKREKNEENNHGWTQMRIIKRKRKKNELCCHYADLECFFQSFFFLLFNLKIIAVEKQIGKIKYVITAGD